MYFHSQRVVFQKSFVVVVFVVVVVVVVVFVVVVVVVVVDVVVFFFVFVLQNIMVFNIAYFKIIKRYISSSILYV